MNFTPQRSLQFLSFLVEIIFCDLLASFNSYHEGTYQISLTPFFYFNNTYFETFHVTYIEFHVTYIEYFLYIREM